MKSYSFRTIIEKDGKQYHVPKLPNIKGKQLFKILHWLRYF